MVRPGRWLGCIGDLGDEPVRGRRLQWGGVDILAGPRPLQTLLRSRLGLGGEYD